MDTIKVKTQKSSSFLSSLEIFVYFSKRACASVSTRTDDANAQCSGQLNIKIHLISKLLF